MKGCLIAVAIILAIIIVLVAGAAIYLFGFEKELPQSVVDAIKEEIKGISNYGINYDFKTVNEFGDVESEYQETEAGKTTIYNMKRTGQDETLVISYEKIKDGSREIKAVLYKEDGKYMYTVDEGEPEETSQEMWEENVVEIFYGTMPFAVVETEEGYKAKLLGAEAFENGLQTVKQKGFNITAIAMDGQDQYSLSYNLQTGYMTNYSIGYSATGKVLQYKLTLELGKVDIDPSSLM